MVKRTTQTSVTNFLKFKDKYLFVKRADDKKIDPNRLNGIGGKTEPGEDYLSAAIRETKEETGYQVPPSDCQLMGVVKLEGGYEEDWVMCFFELKVKTDQIPVGFKTDEGEFVWLTANEALNSNYELVDDLNYSLPLFEQKKFPFFMTAVLNDDEKIEEYSLRSL